MRASEQAVTPEHRAVKSHDLVTRGAVKEHPVAGTGGSSINDDNPGRADSGGLGKHGGVAIAGRPNPCTLVSEGEARAIVGGPIDAPLEAPLGPTCIYQPTHEKNPITLTVQTIKFSQIKSHLRHSKQVTLAGRPAYCGTYGKPTTYVPLAGEEVLTVTAPCTMGEQFAARALPRLKA